MSNHIPSFASSITIDGTTISSTEPTYIIAEAGVNHNGSMELAKQLIDAAVASNVDAVKFQLFNTEELIKEEVDKAPYQKRFEADNTQFQMLKQLELSQSQCAELKGYCESKGITFLVTPFDESSLGQLVELNVAALKISSTDTTNIGFLKQVAMTNLPVILSSGMCYWSEVELALSTLRKYHSDIALLHCTSAYPFPEEEANLAVIKRYSEAFGVIVGYSDHSKDIGISPYAVAAGAKIIEKHFTLDKTMSGPDHAASLSPDQLAQLVTEIRRVDNAMGDGIKRVSRSEQDNRRLMQKSIVAKTKIDRGTIIRGNQLSAMRTGGKGLDAIHFDDIVNTVAGKDYQPGDLIE